MQSCRNQRSFRRQSNSEKRWISGKELLLTEHSNPIDGAPGPEKHIISSEGIEGSCVNVLSKAQTKEILYKPRKKQKPISRVTKCEHAHPANTGTLSAVVASRQTSIISVIHLFACCSYWLRSMNLHILAI